MHPLRDRRLECLPQRKRARALQSFIQSNRSSVIPACLRTTFAISRERMFESTTNLCPLMGLYQNS